MAPAELEAVLLSHPQIADAGVIGLPDPAAGELPMAWIVRKEGANITEKDVVDFVSGMLVDILQTIYDEVHSRIFLNLPFQTDGPSFKNTNQNSVLKYAIVLYRAHSVYIDVTSS